MNPYNSSYPPPASLYKLAPAMQEQPSIMIHAFFDGFGLDSPKLYLWKMFTSLLLQEESKAWTALERSNYCWFYEQLETLIEANYILYLQLRAENFMLYRHYAAH